MKIQHVAEVSWLIKKPGYAYGYFKRNGKFWAIPEVNYSWKERYEKYKWVDKGLLDGSMKDEHFDYKFTWKQYCKLIKTGIYTTVHPKRLWNTKIKYMIDKWKPETEKD